MLSVKVQIGIYIPSPGSIWHATGQCVGPTPLSTLHIRLTYYGWQHNRHLPGRHCSPNYARSSSSSNTQTTNTFRQNPIMVEKWRMKANETKFVQVTFTLRKNTCAPVHLNNKQLTQTDDVKYLSTHLDRTLTWRKHISTKRKQLDLKLRKFYWIIGLKSQLSLVNKLLVYKAFLKPTWTYGVQLWGSASNCNIEISVRFQSKVLRIITDAPWFVPNTVIIRDLHVLSVRQEVSNYGVTYRQRLNDHPSSLAKSLLQSPNYNRGLKRY
jgi:hypothetical protein